MSGVGAEHEGEVESGVDTHERERGGCRKKGVMCTQWREGGAGREVEHGWKEMGCRKRGCKVGCGRWGAGVKEREGRGRHERERAIVTAQSWLFLNLLMLTDGFTSAIVLGNRFVGSPSSHRPSSLHQENIGLT